MQNLSAHLGETSPEGIARAVGSLITEGSLAPGDRLPTVRELSAQLGVSPATISHAWQALAGVGMIVSRGRAGTFVREHRADWLPHRVRELAGDDAAGLLDLSRGAPDPELLPRLAPALSRVADRARTSNYHDVPVLPTLHEHLLQRWPCPVDAVTVTNGAMDAISSCLERIVRFGDRVVVEDPTFPPLLDLLDALHAVPVPVRMDEHGVVPEFLAAALHRGPVAMVLQPRAQNPTGRSMPPERAESLAAVVRGARRGRDVVVVEDDHSGPISACPDVSLGQWLPGQVVHVRGFSKSHGPDLRIAALGGPRELVGRIAARRMIGPGWTSRMLQTVLLELLTSEESVRQVQNAAVAYRSRQQAFTAALVAAGLAATPADGINAWVRVTDERSARTRLAAVGIHVAAGSAFQVDPSAGDQYLRVTVGMLGEDSGDVPARIAGAIGASDADLYGSETPRF